MDPSNGESTGNPPEVQPQTPDEDPGEALGKCLFSQYGFTFAGITTSTAYSVYKRPKNGMQIMIVAGATGTFADFLYGWTVACTKEVLKSREYNERKQAFEGLQKANGSAPPGGTSGKWF